MRTTGRYDCLFKIQHSVFFFFFNMSVIPVMNQTYVFLGSENSLPNITKASVQSI